MPATILIAGNGAALVAAVEKLVARSLAAVSKNASVFVEALSELVTETNAPETSIRKLYRLSGSGESVTPQVLAELRKSA